VRARARAWNTAVYYERSAQFNILRGARDRLNAAGAERSPAEQDVVHHRTLLLVKL